MTEKSLTGLLKKTEKMTISIDTGFIFSLKKKNPITLEAWERILGKKDELIISVLILAEISRYYLKIGRPQEGKAAIESLKEVALVKDVDEELSLSAASLSYGEGIPLVDSLILCTAKREKAKRFYTSDKRHFKSVAKHLPKQIKIVFV